MRIELSSVLAQRADDIAARCWNGTHALLTDATISAVEDGPAAPGPAHPERASALVHCLAAALAVGDEAAAEAATQGLALGASAFAERRTLPQLLHAVDQLVTGCLDVIEEVLGRGEARHAPMDAMHACRGLLEAATSIRLAASRGFMEAADRALHERFRRLRHDLRNPIATIRSALSLMADETVPEEARRSPRFRTMIERNTAALDQMIVARLSDAEAQLVPTTGARAATSASAPLGLGEAGDDLAGARERDDRQTRSL